MPHQTSEIIYYCGKCKYNWGGSEFCVCDKFNNEHIDSLTGKKYRIKLSCFEKNRNHDCEYFDSSYYIFWQAINFFIKDYWLC